MTVAQLIAEPQKLPQDYSILYIDIGEWAVSADDFTVDHTSRTVDCAY